VRKINIFLILVIVLVSYKSLAGNPQSPTPSATRIEVHNVFGRHMEVPAPAEHSVQPTSGTLRVL
jgi:hypothetical protein